MKEVHVMMVALACLAAACSDDSDSSPDVASTNNATTVNNAHVTNDWTNSTDNQTTELLGMTHGQTTMEELPNPFLTQLEYARIIGQDCPIVGCVKSETVNFISHIILNQDGRQVVIDPEDGNYQALYAEAQRDTFIAAVRGGFDCPAQTSPRGDSFEFVGAIREDNASDLIRVDVTGCVVSGDVSTKLVVELIGALKAKYLP